MSTQTCLEEEQKQLQEAPASQRSVPLPPSSPRARPSSRGRQAPRASPGSRASQPGPDLRSQALPSAQGPALRSRATLRGPAACCCCAPLPGRAIRRPLSAPDPAPSRHTALRPRFDVSNQASGSGTALPSHRSLPGPARRRSVSRSSRALQCSTFVPGSATHRCASGPGSALNNTSLPGPAPRSPASGPSPALQSLSNPVRPAPTSSSSSSSSTTPGFVPKNRPAQRRATPGSCPSLSGRADQRPPSRALALGRLVFQSSSSSPDAEAPSPPSQQGWHAVRMRASSPSPPGRLLPCPGLFDESSSSSPNSPSSSSSSSSFSTSPQSPGPYPSSHEFPAQGPSSPPTNFSGHSSSSSSPTFPGLASISTPSPASLRRALLLELDDLSPASPGEEAETESISFPPTSPEL